MRFVFLLSIILLVSCALDNSVDPSLLVPTSEELEDKFEFEFIASDLIRIYARENAEFLYPYFRSILIDYKGDDYQFRTIDTIEVKYEKIDHRYRLDFSCVCKIPEISNLFLFDHVEMQIRLFLDDRDYRSISFNMYPYKFPYETAQIYVRKSDIPDEYAGKHFIDLELDGDNLYYMTSPGGHQIYRYNTTTKENQLLMYTFSEYFAYYDGYLFIEDFFWNGRKIVKYNISTQNIELEIGADILGNSNIRGMDIYNGRLYVLHSTYDLPLNSLSSFSLDGQFIESIPFPNFSSGIFIYQDVVYSGNFSDFIQRFNLSERKILPPLISPSDDLSSIYIDHETLYYTLYESYLICYVPLWDLCETE